MVVVVAPVVGVLVVVVAPVVGVLVVVIVFNRSQIFGRVVWSAGLVVAADVEAFTAIVAFAAGVAPANVCVVSARLVVVLPGTVVVVLIELLPFKMSKTFLCMKLPSVTAVGIGLVFVFKFCEDAILAPCPP